MEKKVLEQVMETVTVEFIEENPIDAYDLFQWMQTELYHKKDMIETQREKLLLAASIIEAYKNKYGEL